MFQLFGGSLLNLVLIVADKGDDRDVKGCFFTAELKHFDTIFCSCGVDLIGMIEDLLRDGPAYDSGLAERVLQEYLRIYAPTVSRLCGMGADRADVEQELRIALWQAWVRWDGRVSLRRWLSWKTRYCLREYERSLCKGSRVRVVRMPDSE